MREQPAAKAALRVALLARVSTGGQAEADRHSMPAQMRAMWARVEREGWEVVRSYEAPGESASTRDLARRPVLKELVEAARRREFDLVLFHESSRLARDEELAQWLLNELERFGVRLVESDKAVDYYYSPDGRVHYGIQGVLNAWQSRKHGAQVAKGKAERFELGLHVGDLPFGYRMQLASAADGMVSVATKLPAVAVAEEAEAVRWAFEAILGGVGQLEIARRWNSLGLVPHSKQGNRVFTGEGVASVLENDFYCGFVRHGEERRRGAHEAILPEELWLSVQARAKHGFRGVRTRSVRALSGLAVCSECHGPLWLSSSGSKRYGRRQYYREVARVRQRECLNSGTGWDADAVDGIVGGVIEGMALDEAWCGRIEREARRTPAVDIGGGERERLEGERRRATRAYVSGEMTEAEWEELRRAIEARLSRLPVGLPGGVVFGVGRLRSVGELWSGATHEERREGARLLFERVEVDVRGKRLWLAPWPEVEGVMRLRRRYVLGKRPRQDSNLRPYA